MCRIKWYPSTSRPPYFLIFYDTQGDLCAKSCFRMRGAFIPDCIDVASIAPFLNKNEWTCRLVNLSLHVASNLMFHELPTYYIFSFLYCLKLLLIFMRISAWLNILLSTIIYIFVCCLTRIFFITVCVAHRFIFYGRQINVFISRWALYNYSREFLNMYFTISKKKRGNLDKVPTR